jgi:holliday junction DNA helicase RuvA
MISFISGTLRHKTPTLAVVETGGVGFRILIPVSSYAAIGEPGQTVRILTHLHVREDALQLYGFATEPERRLFLLLISVSGIGCKVAQGILSGITVADFERAVAGQDVAALTRIPGVGKKTAERLVLELKDKVGEEALRESAGPPVSGAETKVEDEAVLALMSLGYKRSQAQDAVRKALGQDRSMPLEEAIRRALRAI